MIIDRRTFIQRAALVAATPVIAAPVACSVRFSNVFQPIVTKGSDWNESEFYRVQDRRMGLWWQYRLGSIVDEHGVDQDQSIMAKRLEVS